MFVKKVNDRFRSAVWNKEAKIASYSAMTHTDDAQTVQTCDTRSVCKPRSSAYIRDPACIQGPASISIITSYPRPVFEAQLVFEEIRLVDLAYFSGVFIETGLVVVVCKFTFSI